MSVRFARGKVYDATATSGVVRMENDRTYFMRRAAQERSAADHAVGPKARRAHEAMATRYKDLVHSTDELEQRPAEA